MAEPDPRYKKGHHPRRLVWAAKNSVRGLRDAFANEGAFRLDVLLVVILTPFALWLPDHWGERAILLMAAMLVLIVELLNSAVEYTVDRISLERHELSRIAKDIGSAAVFLSLLTLGLVWALFLFDQFFVN
ncbi:diacylglycerol kinase [Gammaproteobacteria bacterium]|nr:diacylglycerol kinase [Gammaproteobacteria bacterium]